MSAIGPGDFVECIDDVPLSGAPFSATLDGLVKGAVYCVAGTHQHPFFCIPTLTLIGHPKFGEIIDGAIFGGWAAYRFRPIYSPKSDLLQSLLKPVHVPAEPDRVEA